MIMGAALGTLVLLGGFLFSNVGVDVGIVVFLSLPIVSLWANLLGGFLPLVSCGSRGLAGPWPRRTRSASPGL